MITNRRRINNIKIHCTRDGHLLPYNAERKSGQCYKSLDSGGRFDSQGSQDGHHLLLLLFGSSFSLSLALGKQRQEKEFRMSACGQMFILASSSLLEIGRQKCLQKKKIITAHIDRIFIITGRSRNRHMPFSFSCRREQCCHLCFSNS